MYVQEPFFELVRGTFSVRPTVNYARLLRVRLGCLFWRVETVVVLEIHIVELSMAMQRGQIY